MNLDTLRADALDRLKLYLETQSYPGEAAAAPIPIEHRRAIALRGCNAPGSPHLSIAAMGRVCGLPSEQAYDHARLACREMCSIFPYDYRLEPAGTRGEFLALTGWELIESIESVTQAAGIERFEGLVGAGVDQVYLSGAWSTSLAGNDQIWRTLAGLQSPSLYNVTLQPLLVRAEDLAAQQSICDQMAQSAPQMRTTYAQELVELASQRVRTLLFNGRRAYLGQARLFSAAALPEYAPRAIGFGMTRQPEQQPATPGFEITHPEELAELERWKNQVLWLAPPSECDQAPRRVFWPRQLLLLDEASALFRPPYPLKISPPGVDLDFDPES